MILNGNVLIIAKLEVSTDDNKLGALDSIAFDTSYPFRVNTPRTMEK